MNNDVDFDRLWSRALTNFVTSDDPTAALLADIALSLRIIAGRESLVPGDEGPADYDAARGTFKAAPDETAEAAYQSVVDLMKAPSPPRAEDPS